MDRNMTCNLPMGASLPTITATDDDELNRYRALIRSALPLLDPFYERGRFQQAQTLLDLTLSMTDVYPGALALERRWLLVGQAELTARQTLLVGLHPQRAEEAIARAAPEVTGYAHRFLRARLKTAQGMVLLTRLRNDGEQTHAAAMNAFTDGLALRRQLNDCAGIVESLVYVGMMHAENGNRAKAKGYFEEALALAKAIAEPEAAPNQAIQRAAQIAASHAHLQLAYLASNGTSTSPKVAVHLEAALATRLDTGYLVGLPFAQLAMGQFHSARDDWPQAEPYFEKAYRAALSLGVPRITLVTLLPIGDLHRQRDEFNKARFYYEQALSLAEDAQFSGGIAAARSRLTSLP